MMLDFFMGGCTEYMYMQFSNLHHSGTQFSLEVLTSFRPENSPAPFSGGVSTLKTIFFLAVLRSHTKSSQCADLVLRSHTKSSQCADLKYLRSASECPVCDLVLCDLLFE